jgi:cytochrome d ubiquinol oxidase subunit II
MGMPDLTALQTIWFVAIALLWTLYLVLEGFDFGVGMLMGRVRGDARGSGAAGDHHDRRVALHAIGPTWAANEVWVVIAVVGMFGAFPGWYAAWSASLYLPLVLVLLALISRNAAIELIGKRSDEAWRAGWERVLRGASFVAPFCWGLIWSAALHGVLLDGEEASGGVLDAFSVYAVLGGLALVALCRALGAAFLALRTDGDVQTRAARELRLAAPVAALLVGGLLVWTAVGVGGLGVVGWAAFGGCVLALAVLAAAAFGAGGSGAQAGSDRSPSATGSEAQTAVDRIEGGTEAARGAEATGGPGAGAPRGAARAFGAGCAAIGLLVAVWFSALFPAGLNGADGGAGLALADVAAGNYTLTLMTVLTGLLLPLLLAIQAWSYWLFRERVTRAAVGAPIPSPIDLIARAAERFGGGDGASGAAPAGGVLGAAAGVRSSGAGGSGARTGAGRIERGQTRADAGGAARQGGW